MLQFIEKMFSDISDPPYNYEFLINLDKKKYPVYLKRIYKVSTGKELNLKKPKTLGEKIQWLKLYDSTPIKTQLTDKVKVRYWIKEKIGENYLKPVLWIGKNYDDIPFENFPNKFYIKCNHGCKWHFLVKDKSKFMNNIRLRTAVRNIFEYWLSHTFFAFGGMEPQYKDIEPQIIVEQFLSDDPDEKPIEIEVYCFNGEAKIIQKIRYARHAIKVSVYDDNLNKSNLKFRSDYINEFQEADEMLKEAVMLSKKLSSEFKFVRVDWMKYKDKLYFNEMTFTPFSGYFFFEDEKWNYTLGNMLDLKKKGSVNGQ